MKYVHVQINLMPTLKHAQRVHSVAVLVCVQPNSFLHMDAMEVAIANHLMY